MCACFYRFGSDDYVWVRVRLGGGFRSVFVPLLQITPVVPFCHHPKALSGDTRQGAFMGNSAAIASACCVHQIWRVLQATTFVGRYAV